MPEIPTPSFNLWSAPWITLELPDGRLEQQGHSTNPAASAKGQVYLQPFTACGRQHSPAARCHLASRARAQKQL